MADENISTDTIELATELTIAWLNNPNNRANADDVPAFLQKMHTTLKGLSESNVSESSDEASQTTHTPAVTARKSLSSPEHIISMIDGKPYKTLRRHLSRQGLTPEQYRERFNLKPDYPMVAPNYSEARRAMAHRIGLGSKGRKAGSATPPSAGDAAKPARGRRKNEPKPE